MKPYSITAAELSRRGSRDIPDELVPAKQLLYSSPATLAYHSPGAEGFGVKRAALAVPGSVMLLVAPGCCGRNTRLLSEVKGYEDRFFFLLLDESDIVTGGHLAKIPAAIREILDFLPERPSCVMICSTCVDALLGTDWERVCRRAEAECQIPVRPAYMYALTREGRKPPMVSVQETIYSLLEPRKRNSRTVNLLGYFVPLEEQSELYELLHQTGIRHIHEISACRDFAEYGEMAAANFNLVLDAEARSAAESMEKRLGIPWIELPHLYQRDRIHRQYQIFAGAIGARIDDGAAAEQAEQAVRHFLKTHGRVRVSIGSAVPANPFELALALAKEGMEIAEIFAGVSSSDYVYLRGLAAISPQTKIYAGVSPTMLFYDCGQEPADFTLGHDAAYYHPGVPNATWDGKRQPYGFRGVCGLFAAMDRALEGGRHG